MNDAARPAPPTEAALAATRAAFRRVFPGVMLAMFLAAIDQTILASALPAIVASLGGFADFSWVVVAYLLAATVAAPMYGHLGDRFGRKRMLFVALGVFTLASAACAFAPTLALLIVARALQGLGGGGLMTLSQALISENVPPRERGRFQGYFGALFATSSTLGPVLGAYLTQHLGWRSIFFINLPLGVIAALLATRLPDHAPVHAAPFRPDIRGAALFAVGAVSLLFALSSAGHRFAWTSAPLAGLVALAIVCFVALVWWERRAPDPLIPVRLLGTTVILRANAVVICFAAALFSTVLYLPLYLQLGRGLGIGTSGLLLLPVTLSMAAAATLTGKLISRTGTLTPYTIVGLSASTVAFLGLAATLESASTPIVLIFTVLAGAGLGSVMPVTQLVVQGSAGNAALGAATASTSVSRSLGGALGVALTGAVLYAAIGKTDALLASVLPQLAERGVGFLATLPAAERDAITHHVGGAFRVVFLVIGSITALGALVAATVPMRKF